VNGNWLEVTSSRGPVMRRTSARTRSTLTLRTSAASLTAIAEMLSRLGTEAEIPRRRARRLVEDAIRRHDPEAAATLGPAAWHAMVEEILDANPGVELEGD
jgi:hypothetical protein